MDSTPAWISAAHGSVLPMDQCCPRWTNGLTTSGESVGWCFQAGDETFWWINITVDNPNGGRSMLVDPSGGQSASG